MPYRVPNETPAVTAKMERCISEVMAKGIKKFKGRSQKESAIAICKSQMMKGMAVAHRLEKRAK